MCSVHLLFSTTFCQNLKVYDVHTRIYTNKLLHIAKLILWNLRFVCAKMLQITQIWLQLKQITFENNKSMPVGGDCDILQIKHTKTYTLIHWKQFNRLCSVNFFFSLSIVTWKIRWTKLFSNALKCNWYIKFSVWQIGVEKKGKKRF